ncbi:Cytidine deaminase [Meyerozyma sp. JA9]|jgi:cytidine deaminase|nr:Cytidine deaminase [Meyerozyma sp. JA9]
MDGHRSFKAIAVAGDTDTPLSPCGICRQFIREFSADMPVHMFGTKGQKTMTMAELLPMSFGPEALNQ